MVAQPFNAFRPADRPVSNAYVDSYMNIKIGEAGGLVCRVSDCLFCGTCLCVQLCPGSTVLSVVPAATLDVFEPLVVKAVPPLAAGRRFVLIFRSSRDGASAASFHRCCDGQGPTLTLIRDVANNVFGGFAGVEWGSAADGKYLNDPAAFLFTVLNPRAAPPALFPSKANGRSIYRLSSAGPAFGDLCVTGAFDGGCWSNIGHLGYTNGTVHSGDTVLTGAEAFTPAEVEVWRLE